MKRSLFKWELMGVFIIFIFQSILHFGYELTNLKMLALICAVNESVWEHLKIGFYGALLFYIIEYWFIGKKFPNFWVAKVTALYFIPLFIVSTYYTYTGIIGHHYLWVDLLIAFMSGLFAQSISYKLITSKKNYKVLKNISILLIILPILVFSIFTFKPPHIPLFFDKNTNSYGI